MQLMANHRWPTASKHYFRPSDHSPSAPPVSEEQDVIPNSTEAARTMRPKHQHTFDDVLKRRRQHFVETVVIYQTDRVVDNDIVLDGLSIGIELG